MTPLLTGPICPRRRISAPPLSIKHLRCSPGELVLSQVMSRFVNDRAGRTRESADLHKHRWSTTPALGFGTYLACTVHLRALLTELMTPRTTTAAESVNLNEAPSRGFY